jgi:hypothetical protein
MTHVRLDHRDDLNNTSTSTKMSETENAIKLNSGVFSLFQKELHIRHGRYEDGKLLPDGEISTIFQHRFRKISWYTPIKDKLISSSESTEVTYTANNSYDHLFKVFLTVTLPSLKIKPGYADKYRIAWTHNVGINIVKHAKLFVGNVCINSFDNYAHDILSQYGYLLKPSFKRHHLISIGSIPKLEQWSTFLPSHRLNVLQPFYYSKANHLALPLLESSLIKFEHRYKFRTKILELLRMQKFSDKSGKWCAIRPNKNVLIGIKDQDSTLETPELWGRYSKFTDEEREWYRECENGVTHEVFYDDIVICDDMNKKRYGQTAEINLSSATPVKAIFWVCENCDASKYNNYSNYTTNTDNHHQGWNPSESITLNYATSSRIKDMSIDHFDREETWQFPRAPWEFGYNAITFCNNPFSDDGEASIELQGNSTKFFVTLNNTDPDLITPDVYEVGENDNKEEDEEDEIEDAENTETSVKSKKIALKPSPDFIVRCRLLVYKKLSYKYEQNKGFMFSVNHLDTKQTWFEMKR